MARRRKKKKLRIFIVLLSLVILAVYGGLKSGEYLANKLAKPIKEDSNALKAARADGNTGDLLDISEDEMVKITTLVTEFITAEHLKKNDRLAYLTHPDYYSTLLKNNRKISSGETKIEEINFVNVEDSKVEVEVQFLKRSKETRENLTIEKTGSTWKITKVK